MIQDNVRRLGGFGVKVVLGEAPGVLQDLPDPDRVFVGGSGGNLADILEIVEKRLRPGGRAVVSVVTPETLALQPGWPMNGCCCRWAVQFPFSRIEILC